MNVENLLNVIDKSEIPQNPQNIPIDSPNSSIQHGCALPSLLAHNQLIINQIFGVIGDQSPVSLIIDIRIKSVDHERVLITKLHATLGSDLFDWLAQLAIRAHEHITASVDKVNNCLGAHTAAELDHIRTE